MALGKRRLSLSAGIGDAFVLVRIILYIVPLVEPRELAIMRHQFSWSSVRCLLAQKMAA